MLLYERNFLNEETVTNSNHRRYSGILSAYGIALADVVHEAQEPAADIYEPGKCY